MQDRDALYDAVEYIEIYEGQPQAKTACKQVELALASTHARGGHLIKFVHDERLGSSLVRLRAEVRRLLRACQREGRIILMLPGEKFSHADAMTRYLLDKYPAAEESADLDRQDEFITVVYL